MIAFVGSSKPGELVGMSHPVKVAAVDNNAAYANSVAVHVLCGGVGNDVRAELDRAAVNGSGKGVVNNERHAVRVSKASEFFDIKHRNGGVSNSLAEYRAGVGAELLGKLLLGERLVNKGDVDAHLLHCYAEQVICTAVNR